MNKSIYNFRTLRNFTSHNNPLRRTKHFAHNKYGHGRRTKNKNFNPNNYMKNRLQYYSNTVRNMERNKNDNPNLRKVLSAYENTDNELINFLNNKRAINNRNGIPREPQFINRRAGSLNRRPPRH
jgi:hypothetical protein